MKKIFATLFSIAAFALLSPASQAETSNHYAPQKVAYHINYNQVDRQKGALRNIQNHINALGENNIEVRVIMHGKGISLLQTANTDQKLQTAINNLKFQGVKFNVCANTIRKKGIPIETLYDASQKDIVPSGVAELSSLQAQGFTYLRP